MRYCFFLVFFLFSLISCKSEQPSSVNNNPISDPLIDSAAEVFVSRVIDGDTFVFGLARDSFSVRILGIDAFEIRHDSRLDSQAVMANISRDSAYALGQMGKRFADSLLSKQRVLLIRDYLQPDFDTYNRLLRHVYYSNGSSSFDYGKLMIQKGFALVDTL